MRKNNNYIFLLITTFIFFSTGCARWLPSFSDISNATTKYNPWSIIGINTKDLRQPYAFKKEQTFALPYKIAFDKIMLILKQQNLTIFQNDKWGKYIVAMGFERQVDTTRVGIFFKPEGSDKTKITLSSLSSTTVDKAATIIFKGLEQKGTATF